MLNLTHYPSDSHFYRTIFSPYTDSSSFFFLGFVTNLRSFQFHTPTSSNLLRTFIVRTKTGEASLDWDFCKRSIFLFFFQQRCVEYRFSIIGSILNSGILLILSIWERRTCSRATRRPSSWIWIPYSKSGRRRASHS